MTTHLPTSTGSTPLTEPPQPMRPLLKQLRTMCSDPHDPLLTARRIAAVLSDAPPGVDVLSAAHREPHADRLASHLVHAEEEFSIVALVVLPGQETVIHDHLTWGVVTVLRGVEQETLYRDHGDHLSPLGQWLNPAGSVTAFAPPGDIHRIRNDTDSTTVSLHVYGADLRLNNSSVRRTYHLPIRQNCHHQEQS